MKQTWRWFGPEDPVSIRDILQTGATGVVSALHHIPNGQVWPVSHIEQRRREIEILGGEPSGLTWDVVESLPVSDVIKSQKGPVTEHLDAYKQSLRNLSHSGLSTVCYNFMPVLDWTRTSLKHHLSNSGTAMRFDLVDFIVFDCFILCRLGADQDYSDDITAAAEKRFTLMNAAERQGLSDTITAGLPGANTNWSLNEVKQQLDVYAGMTPESLRANLIDFLGEVIPVAEEVGISLCCHPDDPPFPLLGLPRVMSSMSDYAAVMQAVESPANGITFCTGSLGVAEGFDPVEYIEQLGDRIRFVHLRNTLRDGPNDGARHSFTESEHLTGDTDMVATVRALLQEEKRRCDMGRPDHEIAMRPDHGHALLSDLTQPTQPGYHLIGRMRGLAELRGVILALSRDH